MAGIEVGRTVKITNRTGDKVNEIRGNRTGEVKSGPRGLLNNLWYIDIGGSIVWAYTEELEVLG